MRDCKPAEKPLVDSQRVFVNELSDLLANRYIIRVQYYDEKVWLVKVKHLTNGRELSLHWHDECGCIMEKGKILKRWPTLSIDD